MKMKVACVLRVGGPADVRSAGKWLRSPKAARHASKALKRLGVVHYVAKIMVRSDAKLRGEPQA